MSTTFFIADLHFGHKNIVKFEETRPYRPFDTIEEHDEELIKRWNSVVSKQDIVFVLGDFALSGNGVECASRLRGIKYLVMGNHDKCSTARYLKYFNKVYGALSMGATILTHIPVHPSQFPRYSHNIHGHLHHNTLDDPRYICVSAEQINLTPISIDELPI